MPNVLRARSHQQHESDSISGPATYDTANGFSITSNLGRVDEVPSVEIDDPTVEARLDSVVDDNTIVVTLHSQASGTALPDEADESASTIRWMAVRL